MKVIWQGFHQLICCRLRLCTLEWDNAEHSFFNIFIVDTSTGNMKRARAITLRHRSTQLAYPGPYKFLHRLAGLAYELAVLEHSLFIYIHYALLGMSLWKRETLVNVWNGTYVLTKTQSETSCAAAGSTLWKCHGTDEISSYQHERMTEPDALVRTDQVMLLTPCVLSARYQEPSHWLRVTNLRWQK